jgi:hypothetical protein
MARTLRGTAPPVVAERSRSVRAGVDLYATSAHPPPLPHRGLRAAGLGVRLWWKDKS